MLALVDATLSRSEDLPQARADGVAAFGTEGLRDAAAVLGTFEAMNRIADATGVELDATIHFATADMQAELGMNEFQTRRARGGTGWATSVQRSLAPWIRNGMSRVLRSRLMGRRRKKSREPTT